MPWMVYRNGVKQVESCSDPRLLHGTERDARQVARCASELARETGLRFADIAARLKPFVNEDVVVTPELLGLGDPCALALREVFPSV